MQVCHYQPHLETLKSSHNFPFESENEQEMKLLEEFLEYYPKKTGHSSNFLLEISKRIKKLEQEIQEQPAKPKVTLNSFPPQFLVNEKSERRKTIQSKLYHYHLSNFAIQNHQIQSTRKCKNTSFALQWRKAFKLRFDRIKASESFDDHLPQRSSHMPQKDTYQMNEEVSYELETSTKDISIT